MKRTLVNHCAAASIALLTFATTARGSVPVPITNAGFENPAKTEGAWQATAPGWSQGQYDVIAPTVWIVGVPANDVGLYNPSTAEYTSGAAPEGLNMGFTTSEPGFDIGLNQVLAAALQADAQYDLSVKVGNPFLYNDSSATANWRIELLAGGVLLQSATGTSPADDTTFVTASLTYNSGAAPAQLGQALEIRLLAVDFTSGYEVDYDDVKLDVTYANPVAVPGGPYSVLSIGSLSLNGSASLPSDGQTLTDPTGYEWDLDGNGDFVNPLTGATPTAIDYATLTGSYGMSVGSNTINLRVTDSAMKTSTATTTVTLTVASSNANLSSLATSPDMALTPGFDSAFLSYTASVLNPISSMTVTPTTADATASITIAVNAGLPVTIVSGNASSPIPLTVGSDNVIYLKVTAQDTTTQTYTLTVTRDPDTTPPTIASLSPADDTSAAANANLVVTFDEAIAIGTGDITIKNTDPSPDPDVTIAITEVTQVSVAGAVLTINPTAELVPGKNYAIQIADTAIDDLFGNSFLGILDDTTWNFTASFPSYTWTQTAGGAQAWTIGTNWLGGAVPNPATGATVDFSTVNITANTTLTLGADRTAQLWKFGDTSGAQTWTVNAGNKITLAGTTPTVEVKQNTATLSNVVDGTQGLTKTGAGTLTLSNTSNTFSGDLVINAGMMDNATPGTFGAVSNIIFSGNGTAQPGYLASPGQVFNKSVAVNPGVTATLNVPNQYYHFTFTGPVSGDPTSTLRVTCSDNGKGSVTLSNVANTFPGTVQMGSATLGATLTVKSLADSANPIRIYRDTAGDATVAAFSLGADPATSLLFNSRQIELLGTTTGARINNANATATKTITINTDLLVTGVGNKTLTLGGANTGANTFGGKIVDGTGSVISLTKADAGTWILSGANTHSGGTTVSAGKLVGVVGGSCSNSAVTVSGGTLSVSITDNAKQWLCKGLSHTATSTLEFAFGATVPSATVAPVVANGNVTFSTAPTVSCTGAGLTGLAAGLYPLITWTGAMSGITPSVTLSSGSGNLVRDDLNKTLWLNITASTQLLTWQGPAGSEWKANDSAFTWWQDATLATTYYKESTVSGTTIGDSVTFSNTPGGGVTLNSTVYPSSLLVSATSDYTFSGSGGIGGGCNLTKSSSGKLTLANANTFAGAMIVSGGTLQLAHADAISSSSGLVVQGGNATVDATVGLKSLLFDTTVARTVTGTGTLAFAPGATIRNSDNRIDCTISTPITGSPAVETKDLGAGNTYLGLKFAPASGTQALGAVLNPNNTGTTDKAGVTFAGSTTGNTVALIAYAGGDKYADTVFASGGWTVAGNITTGTVKVTGGTHTWNGTVTTDYNQTQITGGTVKGTFMLYSSDKRSASYVSGTGTISPGTSIGTVTIDWGTAGTPAAGIGDYSFSLQNGSTYEWEIGAANTTDKIHLVEGRLYLQNFTLRILAAGGSPVSTDQLPVFTYVTGVTRDLTGFPNLPANFILPAGWTGTPTLVDNGTGIIYLTGVSGVNNPYATWAGTGNNAFDADANNDGVDNGMAWVLGALDKDANAIALLPTLDNTTDPDFFIFTYRRDDEAGTDPKTTIKVEYGSDLAGWTPAVAGADIIITPADEGAGVGIDLVQVKIRRTLAVGGKLFARLNVANTP